MMNLTKVVVKYFSNLNAGLAGAGFGVTGHVDSAAALSELNK